MNTRHVAALLRELAEALEQPEEPKRPRRRPLANGPTELANSVARPAMVERIGRVMRNRGMTG